jgi:hypothetical protein
MERLLKFKSACSRTIQNAAANSARRGAHHRRCAREGVTGDYDALITPLDARRGPRNGIIALMPSGYKSHFLLPENLCVETIKGEHGKEKRRLKSARNPLRFTLTLDTLRTFSLSSNSKTKVNFFSSEYLFF